MDTQKFYIDVGLGLVRCALTLKGKAKYWAEPGWTDARVIEEVKARRFRAQQDVQKCDEWLEAWEREH